MSHALPKDPSNGRDAPRTHPWLLRISGRLDELCASHDRSATKLHCLRRAELERACQAKCRFVHLRDLMRLHLFAARCIRRPGGSALHQRLRAQWAPLLRAHGRFEQLVGSSSEEPRPR